MLDLHVRYCIEEHKVSYTTFTRYRPFFCKIPKLTARNTCACLKHENFSNIVKVLHKHKILLENSVEQIVNNLFCEDRKNACLSRMCINCEENQTKLDLNGICLADSISYDQWIRVTEERFDEKTQKNFKIIRTVKQRKESPIQDLLETFEKQKDMMLLHVKNITHHYRYIRDLKKTLKENQALIHIDFSENYCCKYSIEVQSAYYGGSKPQVTLHTGMFYTKDYKQGFTTASDSSDHGSYAIIAHIEPVIRNYFDKNFKIDELYITSDSTCGQYRNRNTFYLISQYFTNKFPVIKKLSWSFSEGGHGKGAADGIGAVIKRTLDDVVKFGGDIANFEALFAALEKKISNIFIYNVLPETIKEIKKKIPSKLKTFKGTLSIHQFSWCKQFNTRIVLNELSCCECAAGEICSHYHKGILEYDKNKIKKQNSQIASEEMIKKSKVSVKTNSSTKRVATKKGTQVTQRKKRPHEQAKKDVSNILERNILSGKNNDDISREAHVSTTLKRSGRTTRLPYKYDTFKMNKK